ncbi:hypothetical protein [Bradyrhizobium sp. BR 10261]|uniref:hypothetical protein n=1 Tax=Bradyrhizobium sp. BR 10261 TaxID=2749992 RepID=UPI001C64B5E5|nr:hypothetical protein [Bradyrhizobium sp. BR 10261]MBW7964335.1 hypothetical protein [Bradyrhizobium sp. BR 10261]
MQFVRTMLAFAIAVSLAMLPVGASASSIAMSSDDMQTTMHMSGDADMSMDDCCPDMKKTGSHAGGAKCGMGFCCVGGIIMLADIRPVAFAYLAAVAGKMVLPEDQVASYRGGSPPFRPPRI